MASGGEQLEQEISSALEHAHSPCACALQARTLAARLCCVRVLLGLMRAEKCSVQDNTLLMNAIHRTTSLTHALRHLSVSVGVLLEEQVVHEMDAARTELLKALKLCHKQLPPSSARAASHLIQHVQKETLRPSPGGVVAARALNSPYASKAQDVLPGACDVSSYELNRLLSTEHQQQQHLAPLSVVSDYLRRKSRERIRDASKLVHEIAVLQWRHEHGLPSQNRFTQSLLQRSTTTAATAIAAAAAASVHPPSSMDDGVPDLFKCKLLDEVMDDPVMISETGQGFFDRRSLLDWWNHLTAPRCPTTNVPVSDNSLVTCHELKQAIEAWKELPEQSKWQESMRTASVRTNPQISSENTAAPRRNLIKICIFISILLVTGWLVHTCFSRFKFFPPRIEADSPDASLWLKRLLLLLLQVVLLGMVVYFAAVAIL